MSHHTIYAPSRSKLHPTMKPVELIAKLLENSTSGAEVILDPFLGAGSTLIACASLGRRCVGVELLPKYVAASITRYVETAIVNGMKPQVKRNGKAYPIDKILEGQNGKS